MIPRLSMSIRWASVSVLFCAVAAGAQKDPAVDRQIDHARELVLSNRRAEALKKLRAAVSLKPGQKDVRIDKAAIEIAQMFLAEKSNTQFAAAEATWMTRPKEAQEILLSLSGASSPEPAGNIMIPLLLGRVSIRLGECSKAAAAAQEAHQIWKTPETSLLVAQAKDCQNGTAATAPEIRVLDGEDWGELGGPARLLMVRDALRRKDLRAAKAHLAVVEAQSPENPELWLLRWRVFGDRGDARRYLRLCSELTPRSREKFRFQPELCSVTEMVESELKSGGKSGQ